MQSAAISSGFSALQSISIPSHERRVKKTARPDRLTGEHEAAGPAGQIRQERLDSDIQRLPNSDSPKRSSVSGHALRAEDSLECATLRSRGVATGRGSRVSYVPVRATLWWLRFGEVGLVSVSEIRDEIAGQHDELRQLLGEIETLAERFEKSVENDGETGRSLRDRGRILYEKFSAHMDTEQALLEPVLRKSGPAGARLANRLRDEHHEQREMLRYLMDRLVQRPEPTILIALDLQNFAGFLRYEMAHEEETLLAPSVLKDTGD